MANEINNMISRLGACYQQGRLVPFLGAGMSIPQCPGWEDFIIELEIQAYGKHTAHHNTNNSTQELIRRANNAVRHLRLRGSPPLPKAVLSALEGKDSGDVPKQTAALAKFYWPLVLTTNYDDIFYKSWNKAHKQSNVELQILGREPADCTQVLASLRGSRPPILWALQGYTGDVKGPGVREFRRASILRKQAEMYSSRDSKLKNVGDGLGAARDAKQAELQSQLVVGHEEYRRVTYTQPQFRRAFAEVFRSCNLLFLGSSLADQYLLDLFGEALEIFGPSPYSHYALVQKGQADTEFLRSRLNTFAYEYESHDNLPDILDELYKVVLDKTARVRTWSYAVGTSIRSTEERKTADLHVVRGTVPSPEKKECIAFGVHVDKKRSIEIKGTASERAKDMGYLDMIEQAAFPKGRSVMRIKGKPVYLYAVTTEEGKQDLRQLSRAINSLLNTVKPSEFTIIRTILPEEEIRSSGTGIMKWFRIMAQLVRVEIPVRYRLIEIIRSYGHWRRTRGEAGLVELAVHTKDQGVLFDIATGRIDPLELLTCDDLRFTVEVEHNTDILITEPYECSSTTTVKEVAQSLNILLAADRRRWYEDWWVEIDPSPIGLPQFLPLLDVLETETTGALNISLAELGVVPDCVLRFVRTEATVTVPERGAKVAANDTPKRKPRKKVTKKTRSRKTTSKK